MRTRFSYIITAAIFVVFSGAAECQPPAQPKPLVNADIVKMVKAGLADDTIMLAIQNKPCAFETESDDLIRLKEQGVSQAVLNAMLKAAKPAPAEPAQTEPAPTEQSPPTQQAQGPAAVWVVFYGLCPRNDLVIFNPTIYANDTELARLACNTFFYSAAFPGTYKMCATKGKCTTASVGPGGPSYFRILPTAFSYSIGQVDPAVGEEQLQGHRLNALDLSRVLAPKLVTTNTNNSPASTLSPR